MVIKMGIMKGFIDRLMIIIKESVKSMLLFLFLFFIIGIPSAYIFHFLHVSPKIAGTIIGIVIAMVFIVVDYEKLHCLRKINDSLTLLR